MSASPALLWRRRFEVVLFGGNVVAGALLFAGWVGASRRIILGHQMAWVSVALAGLIVAAAANGLFLLEGRRAIQTRLRPYRREAISVGRGPSGSATAVEPLVASDVMNMYHRPICQLVAGKPVNQASRAEHDRVGRIACGVCRP